MRIEQLEYVAAVARLGSYRKAAESLHISQPALSESVRGLERELGVDLLERSRQGARLSGSGRDLLQHMLTVLDAVDRLRHAADEQHQTSRVVRIGTVNTATVPLLAPAMRQFRETHPGTQVEVVGGLHADIQRGLLEGSIDLGLVNCLEGDDMPPELETTPLLLGHAVVCLRPDSPLAGRSQVTVGDLRSAALIGMRSGYVMHRYLHRLLGDELPVFSYCADGAEMGKLMVAEGLGITVLPDFSVVGDPLERRGVITWRPLAEDRTRVQLVVQRPRSGSPPRAVRDLHLILTQRARIVGRSLSARPDSTEPVAKLPAPAARRRDPAGRRSLKRRHRPFGISEKKPATADEHLGGEPPVSAGHYLRIMRGGCGGRRCGGAVSGLGAPTWLQATGQPWR